MKYGLVLLCPLIGLLSGCADVEKSRLEMEKKFAEARVWCAQSEANRQQCAKSEANGQARIAGLHARGIYAQPQQSYPQQANNGGVAFVEQNGEWFGSKQYRVVCNNGKSANVAKLGIDWAVNGTTAFGSGGKSLNELAFAMCR